MTETTPRLALPLIQPGQAQKELFHNEALARVDAGLHPVAETLGDAAPPTAPAAGAAWIAGAAPTGAWAGHPHALATWTEGGWRFVDLPVGALVWVRGDGVHARRTDAGWTTGEVVAKRVRIGNDQVVGARGAAIAAPAGGATVDAEARATLGAMLAALRSHGLIAT